MKAARRPFCATNLPLKCVAQLPMALRVSGVTGNRSSQLAEETDALLRRLGVDEKQFTGAPRAVRSPLTGEAIARVHDASADQIHKTIETAAMAFRAWRLV